MANCRLLTYLPDQAMPPKRGKYCTTRAHRTLDQILDSEEKKRRPDIVIVDPA